MTQHHTARKQDYGNNLSKREVLIYSDVMIHWWDPWPPGRTEMSPLWLVFTAQLSPFSNEVKSMRFISMWTPSSRSGDVRAEACLRRPGFETTSLTNCWGSLLGFLNSLKHCSQQWSEDIKGTQVGRVWMGNRGKYGKSWAPRWNNLGNVKVAIFPLFRKQTIN